MVSAFGPGARSPDSQPTDPQHFPHRHGQRDACNDEEHIARTYLVGALGEEEGGRGRRSVRTAEEYHGHGRRREREDGGGKARDA